MKFLYVIFFSCFIYSCDQPSTVALENTRIVDLETGDVEMRNILIEGTKIAKISKDKIEASKHIDLNGKYAIPSLWDMHVHIQGKRNVLKKFFENGIFGIRDMGSVEERHIDSLIKWKNEKENDTNKDCPRIICAGFTHNDSSCYDAHRNVTTYKELLESVNYLEAIGSIYYKIHNCFPSELLDKLDSLASKKGFKFGGHIPHGIDPIQYVSNYNNISSIEHASVLVRALCFRKNKPLNIIEAVSLLDGTYLDSLSEIMKEKKIAFTPNLISDYAFMKSYPEDKKALGELFFDKLKSFTKRISDSGVLILAASDAGVEIEVGHSLYNELRLLSEAGLTKLKVLQSATINADKYNKAKLNTIEKGTKANFLIFDNNPLEILPSISTMHGYIHNGILKLK